MHIAFILDGNRRWAEKHGLKKILGHTEGSKVIERVIDLCIQEGTITTMSTWVLSKQNIEKRSSLELEHIYSILREEIIKIRNKCHTDNIRFETIGDLVLVPTDIQHLLTSLRSDTQHYTRLTFVIAIGYGGKDEIIRGIKRWYAENKELLAQDISVLDALTEDTFIKYLDSGVVSPPELIVRTGGDIRHSGFYLYASDYSEYYFTDTYWPDFGEDDFYQALSSFRKSKRNFGK